MKPEDDHTKQDKNEYPNNAEYHITLSELSIRIEMETFFRGGLGTFSHQSGTAKMGRDAMSVVDGELKVYGLDRCVSQTPRFCLG